MEQKNILRQNFIERDVGKHKAVVLADRYSKAYGVSIIPITQRITTEGAADFRKIVDDHLFIINNSESTGFNDIVGTSIVIICVDSVEARRDILNNFIPNTRGRNSHPKTFFVDAGNEDSFGQVNFFTPNIGIKFESTLPAELARLPKLVPVSMDIDYLPMDIEYYKNLVDTPSQGSCADLNQTLAINAIMATTIMGVLQNYFYRKPMTYNKLSISLDGGNATSYNTFNNFNNKGVTNDRYRYYINNNIYSNESGSRTKRLDFVKYCEFNCIETLRENLITKIDEIAREAEKAIRKAKALEDKALSDIKTKELAQRKREEIRNLLLQGRDFKVEEVPYTPAPILVTIPRAVRNIVELEVPESWVPESQ